MAADLSEHNMARLLARRAKEPIPDHYSHTETPDSLDLSFNTGLEEDEETKQKIAYLKYEAETVGDKNMELESENQRLRLLLRTRENDVFKLKNEYDELKQATTGGGLGSDKAIQRIVELSKKNRDLQCKLGSETAAKKKLSERLNNFNNQSVQRKLKSAVKARKEESSDGSPAKDNEKLLRERVTVLSNKLTEVSHHVETSKTENKLLLKLLQKEVGEGTTVQSILANPNSWRGRSEQIAVLHNKLSNLKADETPPSRMEQKRQRDIKNLEKNRKKQLQDCQKEVETVTQDLVQSKRNYDAVKARNTTLSSEMKTLRAQVAALVEKGRNDDNLITQLLEEKEQAGGDWGMSGDSDEQAKQIRELSDQVEMLHLNVGQKDRRVAQLEEEITRSREISMNIRPLEVQAPRSAPEVSSSKPQEAGFDTTYLLRATEVEKDRLFELTDVLNQRMSRLEEDKMSHQTQSKKFARQVVDLEKLVGNLKSKKVPRCDGCNQNATLLHPPPNSQLAILEDEVMVLKSHVEAIAAERQQDLVKYKQLLDQSRQIFVAGLKEMQRSSQ